ncbi:MAG: hypothetical protein J6J03_07590 [Tyzzerella sp.]|nr:hypothetical protein [Tyzzerella sp.]
MKYDNIYQHNLRLNLDKKEHLQAHRYLMNADMKKYGSRNEYLVQAILLGAVELNKPEGARMSAPKLVFSQEQMNELANKVVEQMKADVLNEVLKTLLSMLVINPSGMMQQTQQNSETDNTVEDYLADAALDYFEE